MKEVWKKSICENYEVSNFGRVRNITTGYILKPYRTRGKYLNVRLNNKSYKVHRLVGIAFMPNPENKPQINHIDSNKQNNNVNNLEWVTPKENIRHSIVAGTHKIPNCKKVLLFKNNKLFKEFNSINKASKYAGIKPKQMCELIEECKNDYSLKRLYKWTF